jgi:hypothetical protein
MAMRWDGRLSLRFRLAMTMTTGLVAPGLQASGGMPQRACEVSRWRVRCQEELQHVIWSRGQMHFLTEHCSSSDMLERTRERQAGRDAAVVVLVLWLGHALLWDDLVCVCRLLASMAVVGAWRARGGRAGGGGGEWGGRGGPRRPASGAVLGVLGGMAGSHAGHVPRSVVLVTSRGERELWPAWPGVWRSESEVWHYTYWH